MRKWPYFFNFFFFLKKKDKCHMAMVSNIKFERKSVRLLSIIKRHTHTTYIYIYISVCMCVCKIEESIEK